MKTSQNINNALTVIIVVAILAAINFISYQIFHRFDLTANKNYSLSQASKKTVAGLDDLVAVKAYLSKNLPAQYLSLKQEIEDTLKEYQNYSGGKFKYEVVSPEADVATMDELAGQGIPALQFNVVENDSFQVMNGYLGLLIEYGGRSEIIPVVDFVSNLEYKLTLAIKKLTAKNMPVLGVASGNGELTEQDMQAAFAGLREIYSVTTVDLAADSDIGQDISALLVAGPKEEITEDQLKKIDKFVISGRPAIFLIDGVAVNATAGAQSNISNLNQLFNAWGINLNNDLVADISNGRASFASQRGAMNFTYLLNYPLWPKILPENIDQENSIVAGLQSLILPWASSLDINSVEGLAVSELLKTTDHAWVQTGTYNIQPDGLIAPKIGKQYVLAAVLAGKIKSAFDQREIENGKIAIVGDSDFAIDNFAAGNSSDNLIFFQNLIDGLALDADLINIRSKGAVDRPIKNLSTGAKEAVRYANIFALAIIVLVFGFVRYFWRRRSPRNT